MKKLFLFSFLFIFAFTLSACSTEKKDQEKITDEQVNQTQNEVPKQEKINKQNFSTLIDNIQTGDTINNPITITGTTKALKNQLFVELRDIKHNSKVRAYAIVSENDDSVNTFKITLNFFFSSTNEGFIAAYELDDKGQEKNLLEIPVKFNTDK